MTVEEVQVVLNLQSLNKNRYDIQFACHSTRCIKKKQKLKDHLHIFSAVYQYVIMSSLYGKQAQTFQQQGHYFCLRVTQFTSRDMAGQLKRDRQRT